MITHRIAASLLLAGLCFVGSRADASKYRHLGHLSPKNMRSIAFAALKAGPFKYRAPKGFQVLSRPEKRGGTITILGRGEVRTSTGVETVLIQRTFRMGLELKPKESWASERDLTQTESVFFRGNFNESNGRPLDNVLKITKVRYQPGWKAKEIISAKVTQKSGGSFVADLKSKAKSKTSWTSGFLGEVHYSQGCRTQSVKTHNAYGVSLGVNQRKYLQRTISLDSPTQLIGEVEKLLE